MLLVTYLGQHAANGMNGTVSCIMTDSVRKYTIILPQNVNMGSMSMLYYKASVM